MYFLLYIGNVLKKKYNKNMSYPEKYIMSTLEYSKEGHTLDQTHLVKEVKGRRDINEMPRQTAI